MPRPEANARKREVIPGEATRSRRLAWGWGALLVAVTTIAYLPALRGGFIWDDDTTLTNNPLIKAAGGLPSFWWTTKPTDYWPVTFSALWVEWRLWGMNPLGYHAVNVALHLAGAFLLWAVLKRLSVPGAFLAAFIFAVHPVNVESVAWITQQKNLWAMVFFLASIGCFLRTERWHVPFREGASGFFAWDRRWYGLSLLAFLLALLSKGSVAMLPLVLLGLIAWRRPVRGWDLARLLPFFAAAGILAAVNIWFEGHGSTEVVRRAGLGERLAGAGAIVWFYLGKALWPARLVFVYPRWDIRPEEILWWIPLLGAVALTIVLVRRRAALFAWGYFCLMLVPVMGFTDVYFMKYSLVADHYEHLAIIGVIGFVAASWVRLGEDPPSPAGRGLRRTGKRITAGAVIGLLAILTWRQCGMYHDLRTIYLATIARNPNSALAHGNMGAVLMGENRFPEAAAQYEEVLRIEPGSAAAQFNLGDALLHQGRLSEAIVHYQEAVRLKPDYLEARNNLGGALAHAARIPEAIAQFEAALRLEPGNAKIHYNLANALRDAGRLPEAIVQYGEALKLQPGSVEAQAKLGLALASSGHNEQGMAHLDAALRLDPTSAEAHAYLGFALANAGRVPEAIAQFEEALRLKPDYADAHYHFSLVLRAAGRTREADAQLQAAANPKGPR